MRSTHACTPSFAAFFSIFTSVVVYSRTNQNITHYVNQKWCRAANNLTPLPVFIDDFCLTHSFFFYQKCSSSFRKKWWSCFHTLRVVVFLFNERHNIFLFNFFFAKMFFELKKKKMLIMLSCASRVRWLRLTNKMSCSPTLRLSWHHLPP